jgi:hypothetical protein
VTRGWTLVGTLVTIAIMALLAAVLFLGSGAFGSKESPRPDGKGKTTVGLAKLEAQDEVCRNNLSQLRTSIQMSMIGEETPPAALSDTRLGSSFYKCPVGGEDYEYDPATGQVRCPHKGHEKY